MITPTQAVSCLTEEKRPEISQLSEDGTSHEGADTGNGAQGARHGASGNGVGGDKEKVLPANRRLLY